MIKIRTKIKGGKRKHTTTEEQRKAEKKWIDELFKVQGPEEKSANDILGFNRINTEF